MSFLHHVKPLLELGICKEYCMPRKTNGNGATSRRKKAVASMQPPAVQGVPAVRKIAKTIDLNEEIRRRAYDIYRERRGTAGDQHQDWLIAEREIRARHQQEYSA
jgi:DNA-binding transcriptional regulator YhcF (GntR family)